MLMRGSINKLLLWLLLYIAISYVYFNYDINKQRKLYSDKVRQCVDAVLTKQFNVMHTLGKKIIPCVKKNKTLDLSIVLKNFEDTIFALRDETVILPANVQWVLIDEPSLIVGSFGKLKSYKLIDDDYYTKVLDPNNKCVLSKPYYSGIYPGLQMIHLGQGVFDREGKFYGQIDMQFAIDAFLENIESQIDSNLFNFILLSSDYKALVGKNINKNKVNLHNFSEKPLKINQVLYDYLQKLNNFPYLIVIGTDQPTFWKLCNLHFIKQTCIAVLIYFLLYLLIYLYKIRKKMIDQKLMLDQFYEKVQHEKQVIAIQNTYSNMLIKFWISSFNLSKQDVSNLTLLTGEVYETIYLQDLFEEVKTINLDLAKESNVKINFHLDDITNVPWYSNRLALMQILSSILYLMIKQLPKDSIINIKASLSIDRLSKVIIIFEDNGFKFCPDSILLPNILSIIDIRNRNWVSVEGLISKEGGKVIIENKQYVGNRITLILPYKSFNKNIYPINKLINKKNN